ncbi:hypothetical protein DITRI_Ditri07aG0017200 [Diplodiscus trichospermus]
MKKQVCSKVLVLICFLILFASVEAQSCKPSAKIRGKKPPSGQCNQENDSDCCKEGKLYTTYKCSPPVSSHTKATLTINSFEAGWYNNGKRCLKYINVFGNGKSVRAKVVDECDSTMGCDDEHDYQPPCDNNIVDASKAVWKALGVPKSQWGGLDIYWTDADD